MNPLIDYINDDSLYVISCNHCAKKNTDACNTCSRKRTEPKPKTKKECHQCSEKPKKCGCEDNKKSCTVKRSVCNSEYFAVQNYFSELAHEWEKDLAKYNLGISELESINYFTEQTENGELLNKVQFVYRKGHEVITREFLVNPKGEKGDKGDALTWDDLEDWLINILKGELGTPGKDGETPILSSVRVTYSDSLQDIGGEFDRLGDSNVYTLHLTLPRQQTLLECLRVLQEAFDAYQTTINAKIAQITPFDFSKLSLHIDGTQLKLLYNGSECSSITLDIPELSLYSLHYTNDVNSCWEDTIDLLKNGLVVYSVEHAKRFKPKDWWLMSNPAVIVMYNGEIKFKTIYIKAYSSNNGESVCETDQQAGLDNKNFKVFLLSTSTSIDTIQNGQHIWERHWRNVGFLYNANTGVLSLPEKGYITENNGEIIKFDYRSGDFIVVTLYCNDSRPRRIFIPVIDIEDVYGTGDLTDDIPTYTNYDPNYVPESVTHCYLLYTRLYLNCNLTTFYNKYDELINSFVIIEPGLWEYKKENGRKYFLGSYTPITNVVEDLTIYFDRFELAELQLVSNDNYLGLRFLYDGNTPTQKQLEVLLQKLLSELDGWLKDLYLLKDEDGNVLDTFDSFEEIENQFIVSISGLSIGYLLNLGNYNPLYMFVKHAGEGDTYAKFIVLSNDNERYITPIGNNNPIAEFNVNFRAHFNGHSVVTYKLSEITPPTGVVIINDMYFYNGLFIALNQLDGDPIISDKGDYAYIIDNNSIKILNLTNMPLAVEIEGMTYELSPHGTYVEEAPISEPINH